MRIRTDLFSDSYELYEDLGSGQFAVVKRCLEKATNKEYAAKFVTKRKPNSASRKGLFREKILNEVNILGSLKHENIIELHDCFETNNEIILIIELVTGGELFEYISEKDHLTEDEAAVFIAQILEGVEHFHAQNIVHLDLKPENVMLLDRQSCQIKVIDFGISRRLQPGEKVMETYGTPEFVAPEIIQYQPISTATDMWSIGVITYILLSGASPFLGDNKQETFANITNIDYSFDEEYFGHTSDLAKDFIARLFVKDVRKRADIKQCLDHPWIKPLRKQDQVIRSQAIVNMGQLKSFIARRRWKQSCQAVVVCNKIIRQSQLRLSSTLSLENINCVSFGKNLLDNGDDLVLTALLCGAENGDYEYLSRLLDLTPLNVNKQNSKTKKTALHMAASAGKLSIIKLLHQHKINLNAQDINGETAIHHAVRSNNVETAKTIIEYLVHAGVSLDVQNRVGETALHISARYGCADLVHCLCMCGADLDLQDDQLESALHVATWHSFPDVVRYICHFGCDVNLKNKEGETALIVSCARGCEESVNILIEHKAELNCRDKRGNTSLHWSVRRHYETISLLLIQGGCKMDVLDMNGETALHIACRENQLLIVKAMCALGCRVDIKNNKEMTPLHTATEKNEIDAVRCLLLAGLDLGITNKDGLTAEEMAMNLKYMQIANLLGSLRREQNRGVFIEQLIPTEDLLRRIKIKIFGASSVGKSTLVDSMKCSYINSFFRKTRLNNSKPPAPKYKKNFVKKIVDHNRQLITRMSTLDLSVTNLVEDLEENSLPVSSILDNYDLTQTAFTHGIKIDQCTFNGSHNFSIWEFSGYEPYKLFYDHFIGDQNCIHVIVYDLSQTLNDCFAQCLDYLEFLRSRITMTSPSRMPLIFIGTHADLDATCTRKDPDSPLHSNKAEQLRIMLQRTFINDDLFDISEKHFVLDARAAWVTDIKVLIEHLIRLKQSICERLPKSTMFLNRALFHLQNWRKELTGLARQDSTVELPTETSNASLSAHSAATVKYPVISLKHFNERIRECINPLASDEHLNELIQQLQLMGEIVFLEFSHLNSGDHMICFQPEWLCGRILGHLFAYDRYVNISPKNLNGVYTAGDLAAIFTNVCSNARLLKDIFIALDLCVELNNEKTGEPVYEFPALNFLSEALPLAFHIPKIKQQKQTLYIFNGFHLKTTAFHLNRIKKTAYSFRQLASLFFRIQVNLRYLTKHFYLDQEEKRQTNNKSNITTTPNSNSVNNNSGLNKHRNLSRQSSKLDTLFETPPHSSYSSTPNSSTSTTNILQPSLPSLFQAATRRDMREANVMYGALIDMEIYQTRYCSRLVRAASKIECLLSLDHLNGEFIEVRACAPESMREELFYFVKDLTTLVQGVIFDTCSNSVNIEMHYLDFKPMIIPDLANPLAQINMGVASYDSILSPSEIINLQFDMTKNGLNTTPEYSSRINTKLSNLVFCGSDFISRNVIYGIDLPIDQITAYASRMLSVYLDKSDPMGLDWSILAVVLGLADILPKVEEMKSDVSKTGYVLSEWMVTRHESATIRNFLVKIKDLGRQDVLEMIVNAVDLFRVNISKDSGIQNSNQTLASFK